MTIKIQKYNNLKELIFFFSGHQCNNVYIYRIENPKNLSITKILMRLKLVGKKELTYILFLCITVNYAQNGTTEKNKTTQTTKSKLETLAAIEKVCQTIIDDNYANPNSTSLTQSTSTDKNLLDVFSDISVELQKNKNSTTENLGSETKVNSEPSFNEVYPKEKYEALIAHGNVFVKNSELLSQSLQKKATEFDAAAKANNIEEVKNIYTKMGLAFHVMGTKLDSAILELRRTQPSIVETYTKMTAVSNETDALKKVETTVDATSSMVGILYYLSAIKNCNTVVSKIQEHLAQLSKVSGTQKG
jgi:aspartate ammonia-lyase